MAQANSANLRADKYLPIHAEIGSVLSRFVAFVCGVIAYAIFLASFLYAIGFATHRR